MPVILFLKIDGLMHVVNRKITPGKIIFIVKMMNALASMGGFTQIQPQVQLIPTAMVEIQGQL